MFEQRAHLTAPSSVIFDAIEGRAKQGGFTAERSDSSLVVTAPLGVVDMQATKGGVDMILTAESPEKLQLFVDLYAQRFADFGLDKTLKWQTVSAKVPRNQMLATVTASEQISPNFHRLRLEGDFAAFQRPNAGLHFRFLFSKTATGWPYLDDSGVTQWPDGAHSWHRPPYTVRRISKAADWIDVDIVLHAGGQTTDWCQSVELGTEIGLHGPSGSSLPTAKWLGLAGDETALPVILHMAEQAVEGAEGQAHLFVRDLQDRQDIVTPAGLSVHWHPVSALENLEDILRQMPPQHEDYHMFFAGERLLSGRARETFREMDLETRRTKAASYWLRS